MEIEDGWMRGAGTDPDSAAVGNSFFSPASVDFSVYEIGGETSEYIHECIVYQSPYETNLLLRK